MEKIQMSQDDFKHESLKLQSFFNEQVKLLQRQQEIDKENALMATGFGYPDGDLRKTGSFGGPRGPQYDQGKTMM